MYSICSQLSERVKVGRGGVGSRIQMQTQAVRPGGCIIDSRWLLVQGIESLYVSLMLVRFTDTVEVCGE